jgi:hypothetical protein
MDSIQISAVVHEPFVQLMNVKDHRIFAIYVYNSITQQPTRLKYRFGRVCNIDYSKCSAEPCNTVKMERCKFEVY